MTGAGNDLAFNDQPEKNSETFQEKETKKATAKNAR